MGEIRVRMRPENEGDLYLHDRRKLSRKKVRKAEIEAVVDAGAGWPCAAMMQTRGMALVRLL